MQIYADPLEPLLQLQREYKERWRSLVAEIPDHLKEAGELRVNHGQASLEELGSLATPPMTKDAIAGRIRRLLAMADKRARELGVPDTEASISPDLLN